MKKQYRYYETTSFKYDIELYHNGSFLDIREVWFDALNDEIDKLEAQGYTYGYTEYEVEQTKQHYEKMLENIISPV